MKCNNCGNTVLEGSTVCPYCNADLSSQLTQTPEVNITPINENAIPSETLASTPTMMDAIETPIMASTPVETPVMNEVVEPVEVATVTPEVVETKSMEFTPSETPVDTGMDMPKPNMETAEPSVENTNETVNEATESIPLATNFTSAIPTVSSPDVQITETVMAVNKKSKKPLIIALVIVVILAGLGVFGYLYEFKSADKRISAIVSGIFKNANVEQFQEKQSGKLKITGSLTGLGEDVKVDLSGSYGIDVKNEVLNTKFDINELTMGQDLLNNNGFNLELIINEGIGYLKSDSFFSKYIKVEDPSLKDIFDTFKVAQNDSFDMKEFSNSLEKILSEALSAMDYEQTIKTVKILGKDKKVNALTAKFTAKNQNLLVKGLYDAILNDKNFVSQMAASEGVSVEEFKKVFKYEGSEKDYDSVDVSINFYTGIVGEVLYGITIDGLGMEFGAYPVDNGFKIVFNALGVNCELTMTSVEKNTADGKETTTTLNGKLLLPEEIGISLSTTTTVDKEPVIDTKVPTDVIDSSEIQNGQFMMEIMNNLQKYPVIMQMISGMVPQENPNDDLLGLTTGLQNALLNAQSKYNTDVLLNGFLNASYDLTELGVPELTAAGFNGKIYFTLNAAGSADIYLALSNGQISFHSKFANDLPTGITDFDSVLNTNVICTVNNGTLNC